MAKKYLDSDGLLYLWQKITNVFVKKDGSKVLSDNNFSDALKTTYDETVETVKGLTATGGEPNKVNDVKVNGTTVVSNKIANITVPTNNNQLTNGAGYQTANQVTTAINNALADITGINFEVVTTLPTTGVAGTIYLVNNSGTNSNSYDEYIYVNNKFEKIGTTDVDLSDYQKASELIAITNSEIDTIVAS